MRWKSSELIRPLLSCKGKGGRSRAHVNSRLPTGVKEVVFAYAGEQLRELVESHLEDTA